MRDGECLPCQAQEHSIENTQSVSIAQGGENEAETRIRHKHLKAERGYLERGKVPEDGGGEGGERVAAW